MVVPLKEAVAETCGGKAGALGAMLRAGLPVPDGFVVPFSAYAEGHLFSAYAKGRLDSTLEGALEELGDPPVAVRSSAAGEDTTQASAAGQHETFLAVHGVDDVADAVRSCWASLFSPRAIGYRGDSGPPYDELLMAVIVQRHLDAEVSGVMFTPAEPGGATRIEASWGLGPSVVEGKVTPDAYSVAGDVTRTAGDKRTRLDRLGGRLVGRLVVRDVPAGIRDQPVMDDAAARRLAELGREIAALFGGPQDIEWAIVEGRTWILQARPITAALPPPASDSPPTSDTRTTSGSPAAVLIGTPGSRGIVTGTARIVRGPGDFARVRPGDILICPFTDPAWTPLLRIAGGVVTETGGVLSHAAIVAREHAIPAVLGIPNVTSRLQDDAIITVDGSNGTVT